MSRIQIRTSLQNSAHKGTKIPVPTITSISPTSGAAAGGTSITITGTHFIGAVITVSLGGSGATSVVVTNFTQLAAVTTAHVAGVVNVVVTTIGGTATLTNADLHILNLCG